MRPGGNKSTMPSIRKRLLATLPPFLLGGVLTSLFFGMIAVLELPSQHPVIRYSQGHWLAICEIALFFCGMSSLAFSLVAQWRERAALRYAWLPESRAALPPDQSREVLRQFDTVPSKYHGTMIGRRLRDVVSDVHDRHAADHLEETLHELAQRDAALSDARFGLVRVITGILPVIGFLGTVVVTAMTLSNVNKSDLEASLPQITASLAVAFDPTVLAISLSLTLLLSFYFVERQVAETLTQVDRSARQWLRHRFLVSVPEHTPFLAAVHASSEQTIQLTRALVEQQSDLWSTATVRLHERLEQMSTQRESTLLDVMRQLLEQWQRDSSLLETSHRKMDELHGQLGRIADLLVQRTGDERSLIAAQANLAENLKMLRETHSFDEALQSITAAVHLLTIRAHAVSSAPRDNNDNHREPRAA